MKIAITIIALVLIGAAVVYTYSRSKRQRALDRIYADLRALPPTAKDFTTPEGAILCLEDAFRRRDIEAAIAAKDFKTEARLMLQETGFKDYIDGVTSKSSHMSSHCGEGLVSFNIARRAISSGRSPDALADNVGMA